MNASPHVRRSAAGTRELFAVTVLVALALSLQAGLVTLTRLELEGSGYFDTAAGHWQERVQSGAFWLAAVLPLVLLAGAVRVSVHPVPGEPHRRSRP